MKKVYNWLKKDDNFWFVLTILLILAIFIFWDWIWDHVYVWLILYLFFSFILHGHAGYEAWKKIHGFK